MKLPERSDYIIGFIFPTNEPNKFKKFTQLIASAHNIHDRVSMKNGIHGFTDKNLLQKCSFLLIVCLFFYIEFKVTVGVIPMISSDDAGEDSSLIQPSHMACDSVST